MSDLRISDIISEIRDIWMINKLSIFVEQYNITPMTEAQKNMIKEYIVIFKNLMAPYLKANVAMITTVYPFATGVVLLFRLNTEANVTIDFKPKCYNLKEVVERYNIDLKEISLEEAQKKHSIIFKGGTIVSVKGYDKNQWTEKRAESVVKRIVNIIGNRICQSKLKMQKRNTRAKLMN